MTCNEYIDEVERLFAENKPKEAQALLLGGLAEAKENNDLGFELQMLNELIGYYRQTSEKDRLLVVMDEALKTADAMGLKESSEGRVPYATTLLNVATGYRSIGDIEQSEKYYATVLEIYEQTPDVDPLLIAGLYNNMSLMYQEMRKYRQAMDYQLMALDMVAKLGAGFEIAVTYANLANTAVLGAENGEDADEFYALAKDYAKEAMGRFEERGTIDPHYCAAIYALGLCNVHFGDLSEASKLFKKGMDIVEASVGKNAQYESLKDCYEMCVRKLDGSDGAGDEQNMNISGLELAKEYFTQVGKPMLEEKFAKFIPYMAIGLAGEGSDCFGFDDAESMDHDWGPDFCIWLTDEIYEEIGESLKAAYDDLPTEFMGYTRNNTKNGSGRRGVMRISDFYQKHVGAVDYEKIDWSQVKDYSLAAAVNGEVWLDELGVFSCMREKLIFGYPENVLFLKIADDMAIISQTGQYNYERMIKRGDRITADYMLNKCILQLMILTHHITGTYPPHEKWIHRSFANICGKTPLYDMVVSLHDSFRMSDEDALIYVKTKMEQVCSFMAQQLYAADLISDIESYLDYHTDELVRKASYAIYSDEELVAMIARKEFEAFDKVQNEGGRASCQNDWPTFSIMRKSQYLTWNRIMLLQYLYDFIREFELGHNLITEKYGRMMESTAPKKYAEIADNFPILSEEKKAVIEQICALQMEMLEDFGRRYPKLSNNTRSFHTYDDNFNNTSYETYLRGEISTYSDKMLQLYGRHVVGCAQNGINIAEETIKNTARFYGFDDLESFENA